MPLHPSMIPSWLANPIQVSNKFTQNDCIFLDQIDKLDSRLKAVLLNQGLKSLFPVQTAVLRETHRVRDVCVAAPTGSGKTLGYLLPLVNTLSTRRLIRLRAVILVPGRELAEQVHAVLAPLASAVGLKYALATGQNSLSSEQKAIISTKEPGESIVDILVATPGRLYDHLSQERYYLSLQHVEWLVLDEADRLLDDASHEGAFLPLILRSLDPFRYSSPSSHTSKYCSYRRIEDVPNHSAFWITPLRKLLFSATLTQNPAKLAELGLNDPLYIEARGLEEVAGEGKPRYIIPSELSEYLHVCKEDRKPLAIMYLLEYCNLTRSICFTRSVQSTVKLAHLLSQSCDHRFRIEHFSGSLDAADRKEILRRFNQDEIDLLVCSDVAARGLDLNNVMAVINYDVPKHAKTYIHRVGRTARAGALGTAYIITSVKEAYHFKEMLKTELGKVEDIKGLNIPSDAFHVLLPRYCQIMQPAEHNNTSEDESQ